MLRKHRNSGIKFFGKMNETVAGGESDEKRMECMKILDQTIRTYREQRYDLELMLETAPVRFLFFNFFRDNFREIQDIQTH